MPRDYANPPKGVCRQYYRDGQCSSRRICRYRHVRPPQRYVEPAEGWSETPRRTAFVRKSPTTVRRPDSFSSRASECSPAAPPFHPRSYASEEQDGGPRPAERLSALRKIAQAVDRRGSISTHSSTDGDAEASSSAQESSSSAPTTKFSSAIETDSSALQSPPSSVDLPLPMTAANLAGLDPTAPVFRPRTSTQSDATVRPTPPRARPLQSNRQAQQHPKQGPLPPAGPSGLNASTSSTATVRLEDLLPACPPPELIPKPPLDSKAEHHKRLIDGSMVTFGRGLTVQRVFSLAETQCVIVNGLPTKAPLGVVACILQAMNVPSDSFFVMIGRTLKEDSGGTAAQAYLLVENSAADALIARSQGPRSGLVRFCGRTLQFVRSCASADFRIPRKQTHCTVEWQPPTFTWEAVYISPQALSQKFDDLNNHSVWEETRRPIRAFVVPPVRIYRNCHAYVLRIPGVPSNKTSADMIRLTETACVQRLPLTAEDYKRAANELRAALSSAGLRADVSEAASSDDVTGHPSYRIHFPMADLVPVLLALPPEYRPLERGQDVVKWCSRLELFAALNPVLSRDEAAAWLAERFGADEMLEVVDGDDIDVFDARPDGVGSRTEQAPSCVKCGRNVRVQVPRCGHAMCNECLARVVQHARNFPLRCEVRSCGELTPVHMLRAAAGAGAFETCLRRAFQAQGVTSSDLAVRTMA